MSSPFNPNQQPMPGNGPYPTGQQFGAGYGQQPGQQMPGAGGYGQPQGFGQQPQQGYYPQGQFQGAPYGGVLLAHALASSEAWGPGSWGPKTMWKGSWVTRSCGSGIRM